MPDMNLPEMNIPEMDPDFLDLRDAVVAGFDHAEKLLAERPRALHARSLIGETVFHWMVVENELEIARWLLDRGADIDNRTRFDHTPLAEAASLGYLQMCTLLLDRGADPRIRSHLGCTALGAAALQDQIEVVALILSRLPADEDMSKHIDAISQDVLLDKTSRSCALLVARGLRLPGTSLH